MVRRNHPARTNRIGEIMSSFVFACVSLLVIGKVLPVAIDGLTLGATELGMLVMCCFYGLVVDVVKMFSK